MIYIANYMIDVEKQEVVKTHNADYRYTCFKNFWDSLKEGNDANHN